MVQYNPDKKVATDSNCGSIRLEKPIKVGRYAEIEVEWYDEEGKFHKEWRNIETGSLTIQHEIDHNLGILITERQVFLCADEKGYDV
jgi:peptide deformylase